MNKRLHIIIITRWLCYVVKKKKNKNYKNQMITACRNYSWTLSGIGLGSEIRGDQRKKWNFFLECPACEHAALDRWLRSGGMEWVKKYTLSGGGRGSISLGPRQVLLSDLCVEWWNANVLARKINAVLYGVRKNIRASPITYSFRRPRVCPPIHFFFSPHCIYIAAFRRRSGFLSYHPIAPGGYPQTLVLYWAQ